MPPPRDVKGIRSFLGHVGFYRRFIRNFYGVSKPLTNLLQKGVGFNFDDNCLEAFNKLKYALSNAPIIKPPVWDLTFDLICEASDAVVGVILGQHVGRRFNIIHHASRTLNGAQMNYPKKEKELFAVFFSCEKFHSYIVDAKVRVHTDCDGLKEIFERKEHKPRLIRWILLLQEFELQIMQRHEFTTVNAAAIFPQQGTNLMERNFSPGDFHLRELVEELRVTPRKKKKSFLLEELEPSN